jgi:hypothetical protein
VTLRLIELTLHGVDGGKVLERHAADAADGYRLEHALVERAGGFEVASALVHGRLRVPRLREQLGGAGVPSCFRAAPRSGDGDLPVAAHAVDVRLPAQRFRNQRRIMGVLEGGLIALERPFRHAGLLVTQTVVE